MYILSYFTESGIPKTGLTPTILVLDMSDNSVVVNSASMSEVGYGFYKYNFSGYDNTKDYAIRCDGGSGLEDPERYTFAGNDSGSVESAIASLSTDVGDVPSDTVTALFAEIVENGLSFSDAIKLLMSVLAAKSAGGGTTTITFRDMADTKNRITATVDSNGNRSAVTINI